MFRKTVWSPVEISYLESHRDQPVNQLTIALAKSRNAIRLKCLELDGKPLPTKKRNKLSVIGRRDDLNQFFRSGWEANVARWFNNEGMVWRYEPEVFVFKEVKHGTVSYCPDFQVDDNWVEVKGYLTPQGKTAIRRFKRYYPEEFKKLVAIPGSRTTKAGQFFESMGIPIIATINELNKEFKNKIPHWE
jgi:hypothetical protein